MERGGEMGSDWQCGHGGGSAYSLALMLLSLRLLLDAACFTPLVFVVAKRSPAG